MGLDRMIVEPGDWRSILGSRRHAFVIACHESVVQVYQPDQKPEFRVISMFRYELEHPLHEPNDRQLAAFVAYQLTGIK